MRGWHIAAGIVGLGVLGTALDQVHVRTGALSYAHPVILDQAWWVLPQFALAFALIVYSTAILDRALGGGRVPGARVFAARFALFVAAYAVTGIGHERPLATAAVLAAALVVRVLLDRPDATTVVTAGLLAFGGTGYEVALSSIPGTFSYAEAGLGPVPLWLPLLYMHGAPVVVSLVRVLWGREPAWTPSPGMTSSGSS